MSSVCGAAVPSHVVPPELAAMTSMFTGWGAAHHEGLRTPELRSLCVGLGLPSTGFKQALKEHVAAVANQSERDLAAGRTPPVESLEVGMQDAETCATDKDPQVAISTAAQQASQTETVIVLLYEDKTRAREKMQNAADGREIDVGFEPVVVDAQGLKIDGQEDFDGLDQDRFPVTIEFRLKQAPLGSLDDRALQENAVDRYDELVAATDDYADADDDDYPMISDEDEEDEEEEEESEEAGDVDEPVASGGEVAAAAVAIDQSGHGSTTQVDDAEEEEESEEEEELVKDETEAETYEPIPSPTIAQTPAPTAAPMVAPTLAPTLEPTTAPTLAPTPSPTPAPSPTRVPSQQQPLQQAGLLQVKQEIMATAMTNESTGATALSLDQAIQDFRSRAEELLEQDAIIEQARARNAALATQWEAVQQCLKEKVLARKRVQEKLQRAQEDADASRKKLRTVALQELDAWWTESRTGLRMIDSTASRLPTTLE